MTDKELWPIVKAAAEGKRVEWYSWGRWRTRPPGDGFLTGVDYRIAPHDCARDGHVWGEWRPWVEHTTRRVCKVRGCLASEITAPDPAPNMVVCGNLLCEDMGCRHRGKHEQSPGCDAVCGPLQRCIPCGPPAPQDYAKDKHRLFCTECREWVPTPHICAPRYRPWTPEEAIGKTMVDGGCLRLIVAVDTDSVGGVWLAPSRHQNTSLASLCASFRQPDGTPCGVREEK